jgi:hypothetical protein
MKQQKNNEEIAGRASTLPSMSYLKSMLNLRMLFGLVLIAASFISAFIISSSANRMVTVWSATVDMAPGSVIEEADVERVRVLMPSNIGMYLDGDLPIVGNYIVREIGSAEVIPASAVSQTPISNLRKVPIALPTSRLPFQIKTGDIVDVYGIPKPQISMSGELKAIKPGLVLAQVGIEGIDLEASKLGGEVGITLLVPEELVAKVIQAVSVSEFLLVKSP